MTDSLFEQIGDEAAMDVAIDLFYRKLLSDDCISYSFDATLQEPGVAQDLMVVIAASTHNDVLNR